jgi:hypothetical protein
VPPAGTLPTGSMTVLHRITGPCAAGETSAPPPTGASWSFAAEPSPAHHPSPATAGRLIAPAT